METTKDSPRALDTLLGLFNQTEIAGVRRIWETAEESLGKMRLPLYKEAYATYNWGLIVDLLQGNDPDRRQVLEKFSRAGITGVKIGDQMVRIAEKPKDKEDIFLVK